MDAREFQKHIDQIAAKDRSALEAIYLEYGRKIKAAAYTVVGEAHLTEDVLSEFLIKLWNNAKNYRRIKNPDAWIYRAAVYTAIDYIRQNREIPMALPDKGQEAELHRKEEELCFYEQIAFLPEDERRILVMRYVFQFTIREVSAELKMPYGTVCWKHAEAIRKYREQLGIPPDVKKRR